MYKPHINMTNEIGPDAGDKASADSYDPVDRLMLYMAHRMNELLHKSVPARFAGSEGNPSPIPNLLTLTGLLTAAAAIAAVLKDRRNLAAGLCVCSYFFDCADGNYARRYHSATKLGDLLDHVGDSTKATGLLVALWWASGKSVREYVVDKKIGIAIAAVAAILSVASAGCLEREYRAANPTIEHSQTLELTVPACSLSVSGAMGLGIVNAVIVPGLVATRAV